MKDINKQLQQENNELKNEIAMFKGWVSLISHNNLETYGSLKWIIDALDSEILSKEDFFTMLPQVKKDVNKNLQVAKDTGDWLRTQYGGFEAHANKINLFEIYTELKNEFEQSLNKKELVFEYLGDKTLDIESDQILLRFVLRKLLHNAIKYSFEKNTIQFEVSVKEDIKVSIIDCGTGISENHLKSIFSFENAVYEGTNGEIGAGLSLKVVKQFVFLLNGKIELNSTENKGTNASIYLPYNR